MRSRVAGLQLLEVFLLEGCQSSKAQVTMLLVSARLNFASCGLLTKSSSASNCCCPSSKGPFDPPSSPSDRCACPAPAEPRSSSTTSPGTARAGLTINSWRSFNRPAATPAAATASSPFRFFSDHGFCSQSRNSSATSCSAAGTKGTRSGACCYFPAASPSSASTTSPYS